MLDILVFRHIWKEGTAILDMLPSHINERVAVGAISFHILEGWLGICLDHLAPRYYSVTMFP